ncbi:molybdopterin-dependent oxidoreductase [Devosia rhodophyticola]|uniref:Molybdopterin-dependent oxidoreductase n=1 Tax=Devosia rhodophyticola TaxID=3026423 RepID=A0ABY7YZ59_9HYPH|nr:molybdopterin-dependent oxidoreductase [Devosia rhodophyticola]WDR06532.1 molybdopterin-dependent oxidoreductase [Devosia rhodophyticola]
MDVSRRVASLFVAACCTLAPVVVAQAAEAELPTLKVEGPSAGSAVSITFDRDELEAIGMVSVKTSTPWNEGVVDFEGVPMVSLLEKAGVSGTTATIIALNDYSVDIPMEDFSQFNVILAVKRNGDYMPVNDQGPFFVIYPFDSDPALQGQPYHGRAVWQVKQISVE